MTRYALAWLGGLALLLASMLQAAGQAPAGSTGVGGTTRQVLLLDIEGGIGPATRDHLVRGLTRAADEGAAAVILRINTPGGLDASTRDINRAILASEVPVIAWVAPQGARAASAGTYILYASHLAAMAPATSLGAATPVSMGGGSPPGAPPRSPADAGGEGDGPAGQADDPAAADGADAMTSKVVNDSVAYLRSLAELRGRDPVFAERAVREAATLTATQAQAQGVVELLADDVDALLQQAHGREVRLRGGAATLDTAGGTVSVVEPGWQFRLLSVLTDPSVAYMLLLAGMYGLLLEGYSPGAVVPGVVGAICLLLALYAMQVLPVNYAGVALIALGVLLMGLEFAVPSFGALGIGGLVALMIGSLILFDTDVPGFGVPGQLVAGIGLASGLAFMGAIWAVARSRKRPVASGVQEMLGEPATALDDFSGRGRVRARGEVWQAESKVPVTSGEPVRVLAVKGLVLHVEPITHPNSRSGGTA